MAQIFISYRRIGGSPVAEDLSKFLRSKGYSVFFDKQSLKGGDFVKNIKKEMKSSHDVILILNQGALDFRDTKGEVDYFRMEIETALELKKNIIPIFLKDFNPSKFNKKSEKAKLPKEILPLTTINGISFEDTANLSHRKEKLIEFLVSIPRDSIGSAYHNYVNDTIKISSEKYDINQINLIMQLNSEFNNNERIQNLYRFIDNVSRLDDLSKIEEYVGDIPNDYVVYLTFFEVVYLTIKTGVLDIDLVDELFRFRFFAMVNNIHVQNKEIIPMSHTYTNILKLYNFWLNHLIVTYHRHPSELVDYFDNDLRKRTTLYNYINKSHSDTSIFLYNKKGEEKELMLTRCDIDHKEAILDLQEKAFAAIPQDLKDKKIFEKTRAEELDAYLDSEYCYALYEQDTPDKLVAFMQLISEPDDEHNLYNDLDDIVKNDREKFSKENPKCMIFDTVFVDPDFRGYGIQSTMIEIAKDIAGKIKSKYIIATVSPDNEFSRKNFSYSGFSSIDIKDKYESTREYVLFDMKNFIKTGL